MKRIISCLLAVLLMVSLSCHVLDVAAAEDEPTFTVSSEQAFPGQKVSVAIRMDNNPGIASVKLKVQFDSGLILNSVTYNPSLGGRAQKPQEYDSPVILNWINGTENTYGDMDYAVLNFTVADDASFGKHPVFVSYNKDDVYCLTGSTETNVKFKVVQGFVNASYILGDTDLNGDVDIVDATWIQRYSAEKDMPFELRVEPADVTGDEDVDLVDCTMIQWYLADMQTLYDIGKTIS